MGRQLGALCRAVAVQLAEDNKEMPTRSRNIDLQFVEKVLGQPQFSSVLEGRMGVPGVALRLAWTQVGGKVMVVEASKVPTQGTREGKLKLTGQLGSVMQESAELALSWIRSHADLLGLEGHNLVNGNDLHLHFPAGAVEKDGPSAGITIATTLVSLPTGRLVRTDLAMTGEISLHGLVLPVGGVRDKVLALDERYGYIHSCPTNLGTGMRASVHVDLPGWTKEGLPALQKRCEELA